MVCNRSGIIILAKCKERLTNDRWLPRSSRTYSRAVLSADDGRGRGNLIECPRPGCPMLSGVVAATWGCGRPDMSYGSVVLHVGDHGAATVVLPVPRLRTIYTASEAKSAGIYRWHPLPLHLLCYTSDRRIIGIRGAVTMNTAPLSDMVSHCDRAPLMSLEILAGAISNPQQD